MIIAKYTVFKKTRGNLHVDLGTPFLMHIVNLHYSFCLDIRLEEAAILVFCLTLVEQDGCQNDSGVNNLHFVLLQHF